MRRCTVPRTHRLEPGVHRRLSQALSPFPAIAQGRSPFPASPLEALCLCKDTPTPPICVNICIQKRSKCCRESSGRWVALFGLEMEASSRRSQSPRRSRSPRRSGSPPRSPKTIRSPDNKSGSQRTDENQITEVRDCRTNRTVASRNVVASSTSIHFQAFTRENALEIRPEACPSK